MAGLGGLPKPEGQRRRRNAPLANTVKLPAGGRRGAAPKWPGPGGLDAGGRRLWRELWATPMAVAWERHGWIRVVARYVAALSAAEAGLADGRPPLALLTECRHLEDRLGLTPLAMVRLRWEVDGGDELAGRRVPPSSRSRLKAVDDAVARAD